MDSKKVLKKIATELALDCGARFALVNDLLLLVFFSDCVSNQPVPEFGEKGTTEMMTSSVASCRFAFDISVTVLTFRDKFIRRKFVNIFPYFNFFQLLFFHISFSYHFSFSLFFFFRYCF